MSNLTIRFLTAAVGVPVLLALIFVAPVWGWALFLAAAITVGAIELYGMTHPGDRVSQAACVLMTLAVYAAMVLYGGDAKVLVTAILVLPIASTMLVLVRLGEVPTAALRVAAGTFGPLYLGAGLSTLALLRRDAGADGSAFVLLSLVLSWFSDTGAYFAGRFLGKHKLYEAVSPKKTIEGALGGLAFAVIGTVVWVIAYLKSLPLAHAVALAVVAGALGQAGDLGESLLKRSVGVKDSGGIVPGHGGILDRVDALLVTGTITYLYVRWMR